MEHLPEFVRNIAANLISNIITWVTCIVGALVIGAVVAVSHSLSWAQSALLVVLFAVVVIGWIITAYKASEYKKERQPGVPPNYSNILNILSADWGNDYTRPSVLDILNSKPRNALALFVNPDAFGGLDPASGDDNKYLKVTYSHAGREAITVRRTQGDWIVLPQDPEAEKKMKRLTIAVRTLRDGIEDIKTAGECEQLAWETDILRQKLLGVVQQLKLEDDKEGLAKTIYPLFLGFPSEQDPELWKWYHRSILKFQFLYDLNRKRTIMLSLKDFDSIVIHHAVGSNHPDSNRERLLDGLQAHSDALSERAAKLVSSYRETAATFASEAL